MGDAHSASLPPPTIQFPLFVTGKREIRRQFIAGSQ
jgi:hypothetical protein